VLLLVPAFVPLTFHWYWGLGPGFWGVAVKMTSDPGQLGLVEAFIVTLTGSCGSTDNKMLFEPAGLPDEQDKLDNRMQDTRSLLFGG